MIEIPTNETKDLVLEKAVEKVVEKLKTNNDCTIYRDEINKEQAIKLCDMFRAKGYHHEIRIHTNNYGAVFFYCVTISKTPVCSNDARLAWSEYVK